jgi:hypothetical protein
MTRFRLSLVLTIALMALAGPAGAAAQSSKPPWRYVVVSASGSATWKYSSPRGGGVDAVTFRGLHRRGAVLRGRATYVDRNSTGCGPIRHTETRNYEGLSFSVQPPYVQATWSLPLPRTSRCAVGRLPNIGRQLTRDGLLSEKAPLAIFTCDTVSLRLRGQVTFSRRGTAGTFTFTATVTLKRT